MPAHIKTNVSLAPYTTLGVGGCAEYFADVSSVEELQEAVEWAKRLKIPITVIGGGSNVLVRDTGVQGLVVRITSAGITFDDCGETVLVTADAGVVLDTLVARTVDEALWGLENLSHIPGTVGAVPVQNVGAYGVEAGEIIEHVMVFNTETNVIEKLSKQACCFAYRDSIFKKTAGEHFIIMSVAFLLHKNSRARIEYKDLAEYFKTDTNPTSKMIRNTVIEIRKNKMPDWTTVGTAGSFFKNPIVTEEKYKELQEEYPELPGYSEEDGRVKVSLGWILDKVCGLRGYSDGNVGLNEKQALILVCKKGIPAHEVETFVKNVSERVYEKVGIVIEEEVRVLG